MESWENKILGDKLNTLQDFPVGYMPGLSSKWEIVEAGLPENKKRRITPLIIRWSAAAAILLAIGFIWMNIKKTEPNGLVAKQNILSSSLPFLKQQAIQDTPIPVGPIPQLLTLRSPSKSTVNTILKDTNQYAEDIKQNEVAISPQQKVLAKPDTQPSLVASDILIHQDTNISFPDAKLVSAAPTEKAKTVKRKIYQRDFNDGTLALDTGFSPSTRQHFSIQLNPFNRKVYDGDEPPARRLQLKQAL